MHSLCKLTYITFDNCICLSVDITNVDSISYMSHRDPEHVFEESMHMHKFSVYMCFISVLGQGVILANPSFRPLDLHV